jgi:hypothetical protein
VWSYDGHDAGIAYPPEAPEGDGVAIPTSIDEGVLEEPLKNIVTNKKRVPKKNSVQSLLDIFIIVILLYSNAIKDSLSYPQLTQDFF